MGTGHPGLTASVTPEHSKRDTAEQARSTNPGSATSETKTGRPPKPDSTAGRRPPPDPGTDLAFDTQIAKSDHLWPGAHCGSLPAKPSSR
jgi:hypothetical protein